MVKFPRKTLTDFSSFVSSSSSDNNDKEVREEERRSDTWDRNAGCVVTQKRLLRDAVLKKEVNMRKSSGFMVKKDWSFCGNTFPEDGDGVLVWWYGTEIVWSH